MKKNVQLTVVLIVLLIAIYFLKEILSTKGILTEEIEIHNVITEIKSDVNTMKDFELEHENDVEAEVYASKAQLDILEKNQDPEYVAKLMFGAASINDEFLFSSTFEFETLNKDLFSVSNPDKESVLAEIMKRITRNHTLSSINVIAAKQSEFDTTVNVVVRLTFQNDLTRNIELSVKPVFTEHFQTDGVFSVTTSVWKLIETIEGGD